MVKRDIAQAWGTSRKGRASVEEFAKGRRGEKGKIVNGKRSGPKYEGGTEKERPSGLSNSRAPGG